jgi:PAS domain S-box-containing protein
VVGILCHGHTAQPREWQEDEKAFALGVANLISLAFERCERSRAESTLMLQAAALDAAADAIVITDARGVIVWVNTAFTQLTGYSAAEAIGHNPRELVRSGSQDDGFYDEMWQTLTSGRVWRGEIVNRRKDTSCYHEEQSITPVTSKGQITHYIAIKRDISARRTLERQFVQAQKMEVIGRLAGGIAHDFNNVLTVINGTAEIALADLDPAGAPYQEFKQIQEAGARATSLARRLMLFSRKDSEAARPAKVVIGTLLTGFRAMLQRLIGEDIAFDVIADSGDTAVLGDAGQIEQVLLNLAINARDAMPRGGTLTIRSRNLGPRVELSVTDSGTGMSREVLARIFEPFFTTKDAGCGTGLGLATVDAIVRAHGGTVEVHSEAGSGTTFRVLLPAHLPQPAGHGIEAAAATA